MRFPWQRQRTHDRYREQAEAIVTRRLTAIAEGQTFHGVTDWGEPMEVRLDEVHLSVTIEDFDVETAWW